MTRVNLAGVSVKPELLELGYSPAMVSECKLVTSKAGNPMYVWKFQITDGPNAGRKAFFNTSLVKAALWNFKRTLMALGYDEEEISPEEGIEFDETEVIGEECTLVIKEGTYRGETTSNVDRVLPAGASEDDIVPA